MENIYSNASEWTDDSATDANILRLAVIDTDFLCALVITNAVLINYIQALTSSLQSEAKDIVEAVSEIANVTATLKDVRRNIDMHGSMMLRSCARVLVYSHLYLDSVAANVIGITFLLFLHITAAVYLFLLLTT